MSDLLHPDYPVVSGDYVMTTGWRVSLPEGFNRRIEDGSLVLWKPDLTFWITVWHNERAASPEQLLQEILVRAHPARQAEQTTRADAVIRLGFDLAEDDAARSINAFVVAASGYVQVAAYADTPEAEALARLTIASIAPA